MLCHRLVYGLPSTECIALEDSKGEIRRNEEEKDGGGGGDDGEEKRDEDRKREEDNAANSRCLLACSFLFFLSSPFPPFRRDLIQGDHPGTHSVPSLFFRTPRGVANTSCLIWMRQARINLNK